MHCCDRRDLRRLARVRSIRVDGQVRVARLALRRLIYQAIHLSRQVRAAGIPELETTQRRRFRHRYHPLRTHHT